MSTPAKSPSLFPPSVPPYTSGEGTSLSLLDRLRDHPSSKEAWNSMDSIYGPLLHRWVARYDLQDADGDDLVQDVLLELRKLLPTFRHNGQRGAFRRWVREILARRVRNFRRSWFRFWGRTRPLAAELEAADSPLARRWDEEHDEHLLRCVWAYLTRTESDRNVKVFRLLVIDEVAAEDVAAEFKMKPNTVYQTKSRILKKLREEFQGLVDLE